MYPVLLFKKRIVCIDRSNNLMRSMFHKKKSKQDYNHNLMECCKKHPYYCIKMRFSNSCIFGHTFTLRLMTSWFILIPLFIKLSLQHKRWKLDQNFIVFLFEFRFSCKSLNNTGVNLVKNGRNEFRDAE